MTASQKATLLVEAALRPGRILSSAGRGPTGPAVPNSRLVVSHVSWPALLAGHPNLWALSTGASDGPNAALNFPVCTVIAVAHRLGTVQERMGESFEGASGDEAGERTLGPLGHG